MGTYLLTLGAFAAIQATVVLGLNIQFGYAGILNFAYITFVAIGAYTTAVLTLGSGSQYFVQQHIVHVTVPWPLALLISGIVSSVLSLFLIMLLMKRLRSDYLAVAMVALGEVVWTVIGNDTSLFNGWDGLVGIPQPYNNLGSTTTAEAAFFGITVAVALLAYLFTRNIYRSPMGRLLRSVREDPTVAETFGRSVGRARLVAFCLGGFLAGVGGGLMAMQTGAWSPNAFTPLETFFIFAALIVGGTASPLGSVVGAVVLLGVIDEITRWLPAILAPSLISSLRFILIGIIVLVVLKVRSQGIVPEPNARRYQQFLRRELRDKWAPPLGRAAADDPAAAPAWAASSASVSGAVRKLLAARSSR